MKCIKVPGSRYTVVTRTWEEHFDGKLSPAAEERSPIQQIEPTHTLSELSMEHLNEIRSALVGRMNPEARELKIAIDKLFL